MTFDDLRGFVKKLEREGELLRVPAGLSPNLEIAALGDLAMKAPDGGPALLIEKGGDCPMDVLVNAYGSKKRMALALGGQPDAIAARIEALIKIAPPNSVADFFRLLPKLKEVRAALPKKLKTSTPPCREVVYKGDEVDLSKLPVLTCWPDDGGPFVTLPCVFTREPESGRQNIGMYRLQIYDKNTTGMHWHIHKDGSRTHLANKKLGRRMEVSVAIGADPAVTYSATAPLPHGIDEVMFAGFLRGKPVEMVKCLTNDIWVPANSEIILEGYVDPAETRIEGPFGDHTGYYSPAEPYPVFHVTALTHRKNPLYFATVVGIPPMEDQWLGWATERLFLPLLKTQWPEVRSMSLPPEGVFHNLCLAGIEKDYPRQAQRLMSGFWGAGQMSFTKILAVVDGETDVTDHRAAALALLNNLAIPEGVVLTQGVVDALDHSSPHALWGGKLGLDGTRPLEGEPGGAPASATPAPDAVALANALRQTFPALDACLFPLPEARLKLALLPFAKANPGEGAALAAAAVAQPGVDIAIAVEGSASEGLARLAWRALSSIDPERDVKILGQKLAVDATTKGAAEGHNREWPLEVSHPADVVEKVTALAKKLSMRLA